MIKRDLNKLKDIDIYSMILFALYRMKDVPEFSALSELAYVLDKPNFLNFCEYFGGTTITVPTLADISAIAQSLLLYQLVDIDKIPYEDAINQIGYRSKDLRTVKSNYLNIKKILDNYSFSPRKVEN